MQSDYFFFDGVFTDQPIDSHRPGLTNSMSPVGGLVFNGRIPPGVHMQDIIGSSEVQSQTARFEADQEQIAFTRLKPLNPVFPVFVGCSAVQVLIVNSLLIQMFP